MHIKSPLSVILCCFGNSKKVAFSSTAFEILFGDTSGNVIPVSPILVRSIVNSSKNIK